MYTRLNKPLKLYIEFALLKELRTVANTICFFVFYWKPGFFLKTIKV